MGNCDCNSCPGELPSVQTQLPQRGFPTDVQAHIDAIR